MFDIISKIILAYFFADFLMGIFHWIKDTYFCPHTPLIGWKFIWGSRLHHIRPRHVIESTDSELFWDAAKWTLLWMGPLFYFVGPSLFWVTVYLTICINDIIHKYSHMTNSERPLWITMLQKAYIIQSQEIHHCHHEDDVHETNYCPISAFVNPVVDYIGFWRFLEDIIYKLTGVEPRSSECDYVADENYPAGIRFVPN